MADFILPHALPSALDGRDGIKMLSLDCFDTLLWRDTHAPGDLFGLLPDTTVQQRIWAEQRARNASALRRTRFEVSIEEIYAELLPNAGLAERTIAVEHELAAEALHCFAFAPTVALMREAKRRGLQVIIVSDTYLNADQLRGLIAVAAGDDVANLIDRFFCSSVYGQSKREGLYKQVLAETGVAPQAILHIGDNKRADVDGVAPFGVNTLHLKQFGEATEQRLRLEAAVSAMLHPQASGIATTHQPHRAALASAEPTITDPAEAFGFATLGPVLHGFDRWLGDEAAALETRRGGKVHYLFLMRDGHLPLIVHRAAGKHAVGHAIEISRFTAVAASFVNEQAVESYLQRELTTDLDTMMKQLLLSPTEIAMVNKALPAHGRIGAFLKAIRNPAQMRRIVKASKAFADRLAQHVRSTVDPATGDTLMLVDLGYNGTVQNEIEPVLKRLLGVNVAGRYLLLREQFRTGFDKKGLLDPANYDANTLEAMSRNVAVLEQTCTAAQGSVIDYKLDGTPIRRESSIKGRQSAIRDRIQAGCIRFVHAQQDAILRASAPCAVTMWRRTAASVLTRLMFLPMADELALVAEFEHDINLGVDDTVPLFDAAVAKRGLRQRGLFYMKGAERMYLPAELQGEGLSLKLALLASQRFGMALKYADFVDQTISLPVIIADGTNVTTGAVTATPTHDGYYLAPIPIDDCRFSVGLQFGQLFDWLQVEGVTFMPVKEFLSDTPKSGVEIAASPSLEGMEQTAPNLFKCDDEFGFMMVPPPPRADDQKMMLAVVFRPIARREAKPAPATHNALLATGASA
ncbi:HAD family hydrolase [Sphingomonas gei]|uniref:HAD family hydrolase n=1 Tax=Sphingomonas gei TaxID=1395960 RepID=A0A4V3QZH3_9SPHN|nr:HAD family hydrolase [Sphingomonas gei]TGX54232.1 HAD family hydrolase [Sphingomonas gei]